MSLFESPYFCRAWVITRTDGVRLGFTDHDFPLEVDGIACNPATGFLPSQWAEKVGLQVSDMSASGVIDSDVITEADIDAGFYDLATVDFYAVDWKTAATKLLAKTQVHEITRGRTGIEFDLRGLSARAAAERAVVLARRCGLEYGGARDPKTGRGCGIDLDLPAYNLTSTIETVLNVRQFTIAAAVFADGWFNNGYIVWTSGDNAGVQRRIRVSASNGLGILLTFDRAMPKPMQAGDGFEIKAGCDGSFVSCQARANVRRYVGTFAPDHDVVTKYKIEGAQ
ncbi:MAG: DUF2163 domain-containing protein [Rhodobacteraceae bacterium]|nr:DUF2163 domain-containing protein [Paracoccaceae bacterium]